MINDNVTRIAQEAIDGDTRDVAAGTQSASTLTSLLQRFVPAHFNSIIGLSWRLLRKGESAGRMAMLYSMAGLLLTPLDLCLQMAERRYLREAAPPRLPILFVCGAPRSGTTLAAQVLIKHLPVNYLSNVTSLFPRSPVTALRLFGRSDTSPKSGIGYSSFYGRTSGLADPNDALYLWDRWAGWDRQVIPESISPAARRNMISFFGAVEELSGLPLLNKNNALNTFAHLVADVLSTARFVCLDRDPLYLAQSLYAARTFIHGDERVSYGIRGSSPVPEDPIEDVCRQVLFHQRRIRLEQDTIGGDRFLILPYEDFCRRPGHWVALIARRFLGRSVDLDSLDSELPPFNSANRRKVDEQTFGSIQERLQRLNAANRNISP